MMIRKQSHDGSLATVRAIYFRIHHGCLILRTMFFNAFRLHIKKTSAAIPSSAAGAGRLPTAYDRSGSGEVPRKARSPQNCQDSEIGYH